jgi:hypothetical protein
MIGDTKTDHLALITHVKGVFIIGICIIASTQTKKIEQHITG